MMLVLTRKPGEAIYVGGTRVEVLKSGPGRVKLGIAGPQDVAVRREEIVDAGQAAGAK